MTVAELIEELKKLPVQGSDINISVLVENHGADWGTKRYIYEKRSVVRVSSVPSPTIICE